MSARQPFMFSGSRPPSRAAHAVVEQPPVHGAFVSTTFGSENQQQQHIQQDISLLHDPESSTPSKPAPALSGLRRRPSQHQNQNQNQNQNAKHPRGFAALENVIRSGVGKLTRSTSRRLSPVNSASVRLQNLAADGAKTITAPRSVSAADSAASAPSAYFGAPSIAGFRVPELPAHAARERDGAGSPGVVGNTGSGSGPAASSATAVDFDRLHAPVAFSLSGSHARALEKVAEDGLDSVPGDDDQDLNQSMEMPFGDDGPRRLVVAPDTPHEERTLRRVLKRSSALPTEGASEEQMGADGSEYARIKKKSKADDLGAVDEYAHAQQFQRYQQQQQHDRHHRGMNAAQAQAEHEHGRRSSRSSGKARPGLVSFLGTNLEAFVAANMDEYQASLQKWSQCSMEEWTEGSRAISTEFSEILDFVKEQMTTKMGVLAQLGNTIAEHKKMLADRGNRLTEVGQELIKDSGAVIDPRRVGMA